MTSKRQQWRIPLKTVDSGQIFFDISVNTGRICKRLEADTPGKWQQQAHCIRLTDKTLVKKLLTGNFLCQKVAKDGHVAFLFPGYLLQTPRQSDQYVRKYHKNSYLNRGV